MGGCGLAAWSQLAISKALEITLEGHRAERTEGRAWVSPRPTLTIPMYPLPHPPECPLPTTHWSQTVSRAPGVGGELPPVAALTEPHPMGGPVALGLLLMDPKKLEMPSLVAQDHCLGGGDTD